MRIAYLPVIELLLCAGFDRVYLEKYSQVAWSLVVTALRGGMLHVMIARRASLRLATPEQNILKQVLQVVSSRPRHAQ